MDNTDKVFTGSNFDEGVVIASRYQLCERLGAGGMGMVFRAIDRDLEGEIVALKLLLPHLALDENVFRRFRNEVLVARSLTHPNIVRTHDIGRAEGGYSYISMEFVDGFSLKDKIIECSATERKIFDFEDALKVLYQIVNGVCYAHGKGIIHRDLKPANVLMNKRGEVKLADFGTARMVGLDTSITQTGQVIGTPDYMSPEQIRGENLDTSCDIYSLGILAYELVTGDRPFHADSAVALAYKHINEPIKPFANNENKIPKWFEELVLKSSAKAKEDRYATAIEVASFILQQSPDIANQTLYLGIDQTKFRIPVMNFGVLDSGSRKTELKEAAVKSDKQFELGKGEKASRSEDDWNMGEVSEEQKTKFLDRELNAKSSKGVFLVMLLFILTAPILLLNINANIQDSVVKSVPLLKNIIFLERKSATAVAPVATEIDQGDREQLQKELESFSDVPKVNNEESAVAKEELPVNPPTINNTATTIATVQVAPTTIPKAAPLIPANFSGELQLANGNQVLSNKIDKSILSVVKWQTKLKFSGDLKSLNEDNLESAFLVNIFNKEDSTVVTKLKVDKVEIGEDKEIELSGKLSSLSKQKLEESMYRLDLLFQGEVISSLEFELKVKEPEIVVPLVPKEKLSTEIPLNTAKVVVAPEKIQNNSLLPTAKGHESVENVATPPPVVVTPPASEEVKEVVKEDPAVPVYENTFQGVMKVTAETTTDADQRKEMTLDLEFQGESISGTAKISGYDDFQVTGKVLARGMEMELKNGIYWVRLTSGPKDKKIRGLYTFPAIQKKGNWEVVMVK